MRNVEMKKGQLKIQEMAFVLVAIVIFFALIALLFFSVKLNSLKQQSSLIREEQTASLVRHISSIPELAWNCPGCIDLDKALALSLSNKESLAELYNLDYLMIEKLYPSSSRSDCTAGIYPDCSKLIVLNTTLDYGIASSAFVNLCRWDSGKEQEICELGKVYAAGAGVNNAN